jgi:hypothetical protein
MALPGRVVAEQELFFITLGGAHWPMTSPVEMTKGGGAPPEKEVAEQKPLFIPLSGWPRSRF